MAALAQSQQATVDLASEALDRSHKMSLGSATNRDLCRNTGRLEIALRDALQVIRELTGAEVR